MFSVHTNADTKVDFSQLQPDMRTWPVPSLSVLRGTTIGEAPFSFFYPHEMMIFRRDTSGKILSERIGPDPIRSPQLQDEFDALLYLGPTTSIPMSHLTATQCGDPAYVAMRRKRLELVASTYLGGNPDSLARECAGSVKSP